MNPPATITADELALVLPGHWDGVAVRVVALLVIKDAIGWQMALRKFDLKHCTLYKAKLEMEDRLSKTKNATNTNSSKAEIEFAETFGKRAETVRKLSANMFLE